MAAAYVIAFCRSAIGTIFAFSFASKAIRPKVFHQGLAELGIPPTARSAFTALIMAAELGVAVSMSVGEPWLEPGFVLAVILLAAFLISIIRVVRTGRLVPCHCFGPRNDPLGHQDIWRNSLLIACAIVGLLEQTSAAATQGASHPSFMAMAVLSSVVFALACTKLRTLTSLWADLQSFVGVGR
jgi:hypothetical protein